MKRILISGLLLIIFINISFVCGTDDMNNNFTEINQNNNLMIVNENIENINDNRFNKSSTVIFDKTYEICDMIPIKENMSFLNNTNYQIEYEQNFENNQTYLVISPINVKSASIKTILIGNDVENYYKNCIYSIYLKTQSNKPISNKQIIFAVNGVSYTRYTDKNGKASLNINLDPNVYTITTLFSGDNTYKSCTKTNKITIISTLDGNNLIKSYKNSTQFYCRAFTKTGDFMKNNIITFNVNGILYNRTTDEVGLAKLNINLGPGTYIITVTNVDGLNRAYTINVIKENVLIGCENFNINRKGEYYVVKLTNNQNNTISNQQLSIVANGISYSRTTDAEGFAKLKINFNPGSYSVYCELNNAYGYNNFRTFTKTIKVYESTHKFNVNLYTNNTFYKENGKYFYAILNDNNNFPISNQQIKFTINGNTNTQQTNDKGIAKCLINVNGGTYTIKTEYSCSSYYNSKQNINTIKMNFTPDLKYSIEIPMYLNITGLYVSKHYSNSKYIIKEGNNGIVKVPTSRNFIISINGKTLSFNAGYSNPSSFTALNKGTYFINSSGNSMKVSNSFSPQTSGILISETTDFVKITYCGVSDSNIVNQFSCPYIGHNRGADFGSETLKIVQNGNEKVSVTFSEPLPWYDEEGLKLQLNKGNYYSNNIHISKCSYYNLAQKPINLKFLNTNVKLEYRISNVTIFNAPEKDTIKTTFVLNNMGFEKNEKITYNYHNYMEDNGFDIVQSYAFSNKKISDENLDYWLNKKNNFTVGYLKASYGTFLNGLGTLWLSDKFATTLSESYSISWTRNDYFTIMSGVENGYKSYINSLDPMLGRIMAGNLENKSIFMLINSAILSEIENIILKGSGNNVVSPLSKIISGYLNGESIDIIPINETNMIIIKLTNDSESYIILDIENNLIHDLSLINGEIIKGSYSNDYSGCYHDELTDELFNLLTTFCEKFVGNFFDPNTLIGTIGGLAITVGLIASGPLGWGVALILISGGVLMTAYSAGLFDNFGQSNAGYYDFYNWLEFGGSMLLSAYGGKATYTAGKATFNTVTTTIMSNTEMYSIETGIKTTTFAFFKQTTQSNIVKYTVKQELRNICRITLGETKSKVIIKLLKENFKSTGFVSAMQFLEYFSSNSGE
ncbi:hypothetical protein [Methanobrevibacter sp.]|uniref:hypothetical protein n=1 Tax=Methanobrevibacter sp. TaxID=66852 RepID=UPI00388DFC17